MKVYIVTDGWYSDYSIQKVFSNRVAAEEYKKYHELFDSDLYNEISLETCVEKRISEGDHDGEQTLKA